MEQQVPRNPRLLHEGEESWPPDARLHPQEIPVDLDALDDEPQEDFDELEVEVLDDIDKEILCSLVTCGTLDGQEILTLINTAKSYSVQLFAKSIRRLEDMGYIEPVTIQVVKREAAVDGAFVDARIIFRYTHHQKALDWYHAQE